MDKYANDLGKIVDSLEEIYGLKQCMQNVDDVSAIMKEMNKQIVNLPKEEIAKRNQAAGENFVLLAYICFRMEFYGTSIMDFSSFYNVGKVFEVLDLFTEKESFTKENLNQLNWIVSVLAKADTESSKLRLGLAYRYLRVFIIVVLHNNSCNASVIANLLIQQINMQNGG